MPTEVGPTHSDSGRRLPECRRDGPDICRAMPADEDESSVKCQHLRMWRLLRKRKLGGEPVETEAAENMTKAIPTEARSTH